MLLGFLKLPVETKRCRKILDRIISVPGYFVDYEGFNVIPVEN
jgi:hypothetical protein